KRILYPREIGKGFALLFGALLLAGAVGFLGWRGVLALYPHYADIPQGFVYNGHSYIAAFLFLTLAILFLFYRTAGTTANTLNLMIAPIVLWLLMNLGIAIFLPGAGFFIIPVFFALMMFTYAVVTQKNNAVVNCVLSLPALVIYVPFMVMLPIGLGLELIAGSAVLLVLVFTLLLPFFGTFMRKSIWAFAFFAIALGFRSEEHTSELQSRENLVCRLLLEKKKMINLKIRM